MAGRSENNRTCQATTNIQDKSDFTATQLKRILKKVNEADAKKDYQSFRDARVTDVLLPFYHDGTGLPRIFREDKAKVENFVTFQREELCAQGSISSEIDADNQAHFHLESLSGHFKGISDWYVTEEMKKREDFPDVLFEKELKSHIGILNERSTILGNGGFSIVFAAKLNGKDYALKLYPRGGVSNFDHIDVNYPYPCKFQRNFQTEMRQHRTFQGRIRLDPRFKEISEKHYAHLHASFTTPLFFGLLLSPVAKCDLIRFSEQLCENRLGGGDSKEADGSPEVDDHFYMFGCIASAILLMHREDIYHSDIKPGNILLTDDGRVVLCDFQTIKQKAAESPPPLQSSGYVAPESLRSHGRQGTAMDMWGLGLVFLELLTAICGKTRTDLLDYLRSNEGEIDILCCKTTIEAASNWSKKLASNVSDTSASAAFAAVSDWICNLIVDDETRRWGIEDLVHEIRKTQDSRHKFWCACCDEMYGRESELAAAVLQVDHEQILIEEDVKCWEWRLIGDQEKEHRSREHNIDRPRVAVSKTAVFLRRLLPMSADNWPAAKLEIKNLWLPVSGLHIKIEEQQIGKSIQFVLELQWSSFDQQFEMRSNRAEDYETIYFRGFKSDSPDNTFNIGFHLEKDACKFAAKVLECDVPMSDTVSDTPYPRQYFYLRDWPADDINACFRIGEDDNQYSKALAVVEDWKLPDKLSAREISSTLYLLRERVPPLDIRIERSQIALKFIISGLESIGYESTERKNWRTERGARSDDKNPVKTYTSPLRDLSFTLPANENDFLSIQNRPHLVGPAKVLLDSMSALTKRDIACICEVELKENLIRGYSPALLIIWRPGESNEASERTWVTLRRGNPKTKSTRWLHGKAEYGKNRFENQEMAIKRFRQKSAGELQLSLFERSDELMRSEFDIFTLRVKFKRIEDYNFCFGVLNSI